MAQDSGIGLAAGRRGKMLGDMGSRDVKLLPRLLAGETAALRTLVTAHHAAMNRFARTIVGDAAAEDVAQEAWLKAIRALASFEGRSSLQSWLLSIVRNEAISRLRRDAREPVSADGDDLADRYGPDGGSRVAPAIWSVDTPEALCAANDVQVTIDKALEEMSPTQRACFSLVNVEGLSYEGVCGVLGISASNARVSCHRTRQHLRAAIDAIRVG